MRDPGRLRKHADYVTGIESAEGGADRRDRMAGTWGGDGTKPDDQPVEQPVGAEQVFQSQEPDGSADRSTDHCRVEVGVVVGCNHERRLGKGSLPLDPVREEDPAQRSNHGRRRTPQEATLRRRRPRLDALENSGHRFKVEGGDGRFTPNR